MTLSDKQSEIEKRRYLFMKWKRFFSVILIFCLVFSISANTSFAQTSFENQTETTDILDKGNLDILFQLNYPIQLKENDIHITLFKDGETFLETFSLGTQKHSTVVGLDKNNYDIQMEVGDQDGNLVSLGESFSLAKLTFQQLPLGIYQVQCEGKNFKTFKSNEIILDDFSKRLVIANSNDTFTIGDLDQDNAVTEKDLTILKENLNSTSQEDLNRDGMWDIIDYTYLYNNLNASGTEWIENTAAIPGSFLETSEMDSEVKKLFDPSGNESIEFSNQDQIISEDKPVNIEIPFQKEMELQYIKLLVPEDSSAVSKGSVIVETPGGTTQTVSFESKMAQVAQTRQVVAFSEESNKRREITIDLGKRVVIKKVTIQVTDTQEESKLASIAKVEFLQNLIPTIQDEANQVKNVTAKSGDKSVTLNWNKMANVEKYKINYGTSSQNYTDELFVSSLTANIQGLLNDTTYYFTVSGVNGDWVGIPSIEISCTPREITPPGRVGGVKAEEGDTYVTLKWGAEKSAASYNLFYKEEESKEEYKKITDIKETTYTVAGLTNDTAYIFCISAVNEYGEGAKSPEVRGIPKHIEITEPTGIPTKNKLDKSAITSIQLSHKDHYNTQLYPNGVDPYNVIDGDYSTHWTARGNWWENQGFVVTFDQAYEMNHLAWITRLDQEAYKTSINRYYIEVWDEGDDLTKAGTVLVPYGSYIPSGQNSKTGVKILTFEKSSVKQIKVSTKMSDGGAANPSASEILFYTYYSLVDEITALFKDDLHTKLKSGVTLETITELEKQVNGDTGEFYVDKAVLSQELEVAKSLLTDIPIQNIIPVEIGRNAGSDTSRNFAMTLNDMQPLGITAKEGETLLIYVEGTDPKEMPKLVLSQYAGEAGNWNQSILLKTGRNIITVPKFTSSIYEQGGSIYLTYHGTESIQINLINGKQIPMLNLPEFTFETQPDETEVKESIRKYITFLEDYKPTIANKNTIETSVENSTELATKHVLLSIPSEAVAQVLKQYTNMEDKVTAIYNTLLAWEKNMEIHYTVCGLSKDATESMNMLPTSRINIRYMTITGKAFMYAGGAHIGIGYGSCKETVSGKLPQNGKSGLFGWGLNHEIGHVLDQSGLVYAETTNNIHSLFSQTYDGDKNIGTSRLEGGIYDSVYQKVSLSTPGKANNVFVQLAMYWQLHLAYDDDTQPYDFYNRLYQTLRKEKSASQDQDMLFVRLACDTAQKDLTDFFRHWGITIDNDTAQYIKEKGYSKENRAIYYLNDEARRYRVANKGSGFTGTEQITVNVSQATDSETGTPIVNLEINVPNAVSNDILGYEIKRNGETIAFTTSPIYEDASIILQNVELNYTVTVYDYLLNTKKVSAAPFKIVYDGVMENTNWNYDINGSKITVHMDSKQNVVGIKLKNLSITTPTLSGSAISAQQTIPITLSYAGSADSGQSAIYYFNPPENKNVDPRIWTYGMDEFSIELAEFTDYTAQQAKESLLLLQYPGDDIAFYSPEEQNTIGILKEDYQYGAGMEEVIKKGSVIVVGNYRGDPIYNAIKLYGTFSSEPEEGSDDDAVLEEPALISGEQFLFAEVPEDKVMTNISNGFWVYVLNITEDNKLPDTIKAELYRVDNPDTLEGERKVSDTIAIPVPTYDTLPLITLTNTSNYNGGN